MLDSLPFVVMLVDEEHEIVLANRALATALGTTAEELEGQNCPRAVHGIDEPVEYSPWRKR